MYEDGMKSVQNENPVILVLCEALRSSCPKVISPEVMLPEIYSHVARYFESCRPKFHNAQKDSKTASQSEM